MYLYQTDSNHGVGSEIGDLSSEDMKSVEVVEEDHHSKTQKLDQVGSWTRPLELTSEGGFKILMDWILSKALRARSATLARNGDPKTVDRKGQQHLEMIAIRSPNDGSVTSSESGICFRTWLVLSCLTRNRFESLSKILNHGHRRPPPSFAFVLIAYFF